MFAHGLLLITVAAALLALIWQNWPGTTLVKDKLERSYDYVIVGAGSAGCVLANRLTEEADLTVALLEAGAEETKYTMFDIPMAALDNQLTSADWAYKTVPQKHACQSLNDKKSSWPRGRALGGTSNINFLLYNRGSRHDYDEWAASGCKGWSYRDVLPYFIKAEKNRNKRYRKSGYHGFKGPMVVSDTFVLPKITSAWLDAGRELGYKILDVNGQDQLGLSHYQTTTDWGKRISTATAYLRPVMTRPNLHVIVESHVTKILINNGRAVGVEYTKNGTVQRVMAKREVILSAGAVGSPHLLMLSGIGPKNHLDDMGIPVIADLPVGQNLQDHLWTDAMSFIVDVATASTSRAKSFLALLDYFIFGAGYLSSPGLEGVGFFKSQHQPDSQSYPEIQLNMQISIFGNNKPDNTKMKRAFNMNTKVFDTLHAKNHGLDGLVIIPTLLHPRSRGNITLSSTDPKHHPDINPNYLADPHDVQVLIEGIRLSQALMSTRSMKDLGALFTDQIHPSCKQHPVDSDVYWECYIRHNTLTLYQPTSTCKMGAASDSLAVVDPHLRVRGVKGLRVVDASVIPNAISGNLNAPVIMIAEKAADLIKGKVTVKPAKVLDGEFVPEAEEEDVHLRDAHGEL